MYDDWYAIIICTTHAKGEELDSIRNKERDYDISRSNSLDEAIFAYAKTIP
jgi:hypothetical protein